MGNLGGWPLFWFKNSLENFRLALNLGFRKLVQFILFWFLNHFGLRHKIEIIKIATVTCLAEAKIWSHISSCDVY